MPRALLIDAARTPFGRYRGGVSHNPIEDLAKTEKQNAGIPAPW